MIGIRFFRTREMPFPGWDLGPGIPRVVSVHVEARDECGIWHQRHVWRHEDGSIEIEVWIPSRGCFWRDDQEIAERELAGGRE